MKIRNKDAVYGLFFGCILLFVFLVIFSIPLVIFTFIIPVIPLIFGPIILLLIFVWVFLSLIKIGIVASVTDKNMEVKGLEIVELREDGFKLMGLRDLFVPYSSVEKIIHTRWLFINSYVVFFYRDDVLCRFNFHILFRGLDNIIQNRIVTLPGLFSAGVLSATLSGLFFRKLSFKAFLERYFGRREEVAGMEGTPLVTYKGGVIVGDIKNLDWLGEELKSFNSLLEVESEKLYKLSIWFWASWPFAELRIYDDFVYISVNSYPFVIPRDRIDKIKMRGNVFGMTVNLIHTEPSAPTRISFFPIGFNEEKFRGLLGDLVEVTKS